MAAMTITLELPDDLAEEFRSLPEAERNHYAIALLRAGREAAAINGEEQDIPPTSAEDLAAIGRGLADADAGRLITSSDFFAHLDARAARRRNGSAATEGGSR